MRGFLLSLEAHKSKYYHLEFGTTVTRRNLGKANEKRDYKIFEEFTYVLIEEVRNSCYKSDFEINVEGNVYAFDSSTIDLCLSLFWWAEFRKAKGGIKLHALYDVKILIPTFLHISNTKMHDVNALDLISYDPGSFYVIDKAYIDFKRLYHFHQQRAFFVTRAKDNMRFSRMYSSSVNKTTRVKYDQIGKLETYYPSRDYPEKLMRIKYNDSETNKELIFLTHNMELKPSDIAYLYKERWDVDLFFKRM